MGENTKIEWCHHTMNPWRGCAKVSTGCQHCYAETLSGRFGGAHGEWGPNGARVVASESKWREPLRWDRLAREAGERHRVFCASMADVFEARDDLDVHRERLWALIEATPNLDWLLLTKRPEQIMQRIPERWRGGLPRNVWVGTSVEDQRAADERIPHLLRVPAVVRFLSCEPLVGAADLRWALVSRWDGGCVDGCLESDLYDSVDGATRCRRCGWPLGGTPGPAIHWVIVGGESGHGARPVHPAWVRSLRDQCAKAGVPFLWKQWGEWLPKRQTPAHVTPFKDVATWGCLSLDGTYSAQTTCWNGRDDVVAPDGGHEVCVLKVGKRAAGRLLDGIEHNEFPGVSDV